MGRPSPLYLQTSPTWLLHRLAYKLQFNRICHARKHPTNTSFQYTQLPGLNGKGTSNPAITHELSNHTILWLNGKGKRTRNEHGRRRAASAGLYLQGHSVAYSCAPFWRAHHEGATVPIQRKTTRRAGARQNTAQKCRRLVTQQKIATIHTQTTMVPKE